MCRQWHLDFSGIHSRYSNLQCIIADVTEEQVYRYRTLKVRLNHNGLVARSRMIVTPGRPQDYV